MAAEPFKEDFLQRIKEVHWSTTKYWVAIDVLCFRPQASIGFSGPDDAEILQERTYRLSDQSGPVDPSYVVWLQRTEPGFKSSTEGFFFIAALHELPYSTTRREVLQFVNATQFSQNRVIGYDTIEDAFGVDNPIGEPYAIPSEPRFVNNETFPLLDNPYPPDPFVPPFVIYPTYWLYSLDEAGEAAAKLAEIQEWQAYMAVNRPFPGGATTIKPNQLYWYPGNYTLELYTPPPPDPTETGISEYSCIFEVSIKDGEDKTFSLELAGGTDPSDGSSMWTYIDIELYTKKSGIPDGSGGFEDHTVEDSGQNVFVGNQLNDDDAMFMCDPLNPDGALQDGSYQFTLGKRAWKQSDPAGVGSTKPPVPGKIAEVWCTSHNYQAFFYRTKVTDPFQPITLGNPSNHAPGPYGPLVP